MNLILYCKTKNIPKKINYCKKSSIYNNRSTRTNQHYSAKDDLRLFNVSHLLNGE